MQHTVTFVQDNKKYVSKPFDFLKNFPTPFMKNITKNAANNII